MHDGALTPFIPKIILLIVQFDPLFIVYGYAYAVNETWFDVNRLPIVLINFLQRQLDHVKCSK